MGSNIAAAPHRQWCGAAAPEVSHPRAEWVGRPTTALDRYESVGRVTGISGTVTGNSSTTESTTSHDGVGWQLFDDCVGGQLGE